ncbi:MAG: Protein of unknown function (DUF559)/Domain of unknown function [Acidimicrobiales bacterium]|nr:Protein of unknown function (DUF559)/Domain of unknown function [Acidimicrobiales bacterium]
MHEQELAALARRQHGLILLDQAIRVGASRRVLDTRVASGALIRVARRLYRVAAMPVTYEQRALGACLLAGPGAAASHMTAGVLHRLAGIRRGRIHVTVPADRHGSSPLATVHRTSWPARTVRINGIPVTPVSRTLGDIAAGLGVDALAVAVDDALIRRLTTPTEVRRTVAELSGGLARKGRQELLDVLEAWTPGPLPGSVAEMRLARMIIAAGFPALERQVEIFDASGRLVARVDLGDRAAKLAVEYEGADGHSLRTVVRDRARENAIAAEGWTVLTATAATMRSGRNGFLRSMEAVYRQAA